MTDSESQAATAFIERWERSGAAERSNHQLFISELCDLIDVPHPNPAPPSWVLSYSGLGIILEKRRHPPGLKSFI